MKNQGPEYDLRFLGWMLVSLLIILDVVPQLTPLLMFLPFVIIPLRQFRHRKQIRHQQKLQLQQQQKIEQYIAANEAGHRFDPATGQLIPQGFPAPAKPQNRYEELLHGLRQADKAIPDEAMSQTIRHLEHQCQKLFALAQQDEEKAELLRRFEEYYIPTALRLLDTYATLEQEDTVGVNIQAARSDIEHAMELLVTAAAQQLEQLYAVDALEVGAEAAVLEQMLQQDGLIKPTAQTETASAPQPTLHPYQTK